MILVFFINFTKKNIHFLHGFSYQEYIVDGENYMRVKFYVSGQKRKGTVHVDVKQVCMLDFTEFLLHSYSE
jgi:hypothetical protein